MKRGIRNIENKGEKSDVELKPLHRCSSSNGQVNVASMVDDRRALNNGLYPIKIRVTYKREKKYYSTGQSISIESWVKLESGKSKVELELKKVIQIAFDRVKNHVGELVDSDSFTFSNLNNRLSVGTIDTLTAAFEARKILLKKEGRIGSFESYRTTLNSIEKFNGANIPFAAVTLDWLNRYDKWLRKEGLSDTTVGIYMRTLRSIINEGLKIGVIKQGQYPFRTKFNDGYQIPSSEGRKLALSLGEIGMIAKYTCNTTSESRCRDLWLFSYFCNGANIFDVLRLKFKDIASDEVSFYRKKTEKTATKKKKLVKVSLLPEMQTIIDRWGNSSRPENFIFPFLNGDETPEVEDRIVSNTVRLMNKKMAVIGEALGIGKITTYTARHSYATVLKRSGANISYISESLGHSDIKTTENYLASFEKEERLKTASQLTKYQ
jgi:integrase